VTLKLCLFALAQKHISILTFISAVLLMLPGGVFPDHYQLFGNVIRSPFFCTLPEQLLLLEQQQE